MKKILLGLLVVAGLWSCKKYDDTELVNKVEQLELTSAELQSQIDAINAQLTLEVENLTSLIKAVEQLTNTQSVIAHTNLLNVQSQLEKAIALLAQADADNLVVALTAVAEAEASLAEVITSSLTEIAAVLGAQSDTDAALQSQIDDLLSAIAALDSDLAAEVVDLEKALADTQVLLAAADAIIQSQVTANAEDIAAIQGRLDAIDTELIRLDGLVDFNFDFADGLRKEIDEIKRDLYTFPSGDVGLIDRVVALEQAVNALQALTDNSIVDYRFDSQLLYLIDADGNEIEINLNKFVTQYDFDTDLKPAIDDAIQALEDTVNSIPTNITWELTQFSETVSATWTASGNSYTNDLNDARFTVFQNSNGTWKAEGYYNSGTQVIRSNVPTREDAVADGIDVFSINIRNVSVTSYRLDYSITGPTQGVSVTYNGVELESGYIISPYLDGYLGIYYNVPGNDEVLLTTFTSSGPLEDSGSAARIVVDL